MEETLLEVGVETTAVRVPTNDWEKLFGSILMFIGGGLMMTIIGAIIGLPLAIWGISIFFKKHHAHQGPCPHCQTHVNILTNIPGFNCPACDKRIMVRDARFFRIV